MNINSKKRTELTIDILTKISNFKKIINQKDEIIMININKLEKIITNGSIEQRDIILDKIENGLSIQDVIKLI